MTLKSCFHNFSCYVINKHLGAMTHGVLMAFVLYVLRCALESQWAVGMRKPGILNGSGKTWWNVEDTSDHLRMKLLFGSIAKDVLSGNTLLQLLFSTYHSNIRTEMLDERAHRPAAPGARKQDFQPYCDVSQPL